MTNVCMVTSTGEGQTSIVWDRSRSRAGQREALHCYTALMMGGGDGDSTLMGKLSTTRFDKRNHVVGVQHT
eukprot:7810896-Pyramimonas_sp.AAC.1